MRARVVCECINSHVCLLWTCCVCVCDAYIIIAAVQRVHSPWICLLYYLRPGWWEWDRMGCDVRACVFMLATLFAPIYGVLMIGCVFTHVGQACLQCLVCVCVCECERMGSNYWNEIICICAERERETLACNGSRTDINPNIRFIAASIDWIHGELYMIIFTDVCFLTGRWMIMHR